MFMSLKIVIFNFIFILAGTVAKYDLHLHPKSNYIDVPTTHSKLKFVNGKLFGSSISIDTDAMRLVKEVDENWFHQTLDHFNSKDKRKWKQVTFLSML